ncbi:MAG: adenine deaminase [Flavobacteriales bacterium]|jgi:adenine deaminase|nr:adenine deaminase [Flavobacteriales bacterium]
MADLELTGNLVDIPRRTIRPTRIRVSDGHIATIEEITGPVDGFILPGFIDAHVHVESSMLIPSEFARLAVLHGTVATISDPHEIANVLGVEGVEYMIDNGRQVPFHFHFGAPSCVPATPFETAGASINAEQVGRLLERPEVLYLSEMMNFPGVLNGDPEVLRKIAHAQRLGKPVDGHAPGLRGDAAGRYIAAGMSTDHECFTAEEALDKLQQGMWVQIREGSAAKNFEALHPLLHDHWERMMFCSDDKHPDGLVVGHINTLCARAIKAGVDPFKVLQVACLNPILHYGLPVGRLRVGDPADLVVVDDLTGFKVRQTLIRGQVVAENGRSLIPRVKAGTPNQFHCQRKAVADLHVPAVSGDLLVIEPYDGQLITGKRNMPPTIAHGACVADPERDLLKIAVVNRYRDAPVATAWISGLGLERGAIASCVAHDSHNIVAVGTNDQDMVEAINAVIDGQGGISLVDGPRKMSLPLPVAGIMSTADAYEVARDYSRIDQTAKALGCRMSAPYMTLSFMALLVIPHLKISDLGLFDGDTFTFVKPPNA